MNLLEKICEELGVEVGEEWLGNDGFRYQIMGDGKIRRCTHDGEAIICVGYDLWAGIIGGNLKPVWKPKQYEKYYMPNLYHFNDEEKYDSWCWEGYEQEEWLLENNMVFRTKEEAIEATNKMLNALKED